MRPTRRSVLRAGAFSAALAPLATVAGARGRSSAAPTLVVVFLRGGCDGLNLVVPHGDEHYYELRRNIAVPRPDRGGAIDLDGFFGLHPAAAPLRPLFADGTAAAIHAVGSPANSRSHFVEQDVWETGLLEPALDAQGWLNRHLQTGDAHGPLRAVCIGDSLPRILRGDREAVAVRGLDDLTFGGGGQDIETLIAALERAHAQEGARGEADELLRRGGRETIEALRTLQAAARRVTRSEVDYPDSDLARRLSEVARLVKAEVGLEVAVVDYGGWDTHQNQGGVGGPYHQLVADLAGSLAAFCADLEDRLDDVVVVTLSEFGRTAFQNGTMGTDHGWASAMLALGGRIRTRGEGRPRNVLGRWPGLGPDQLHERRDLADTTDFRDVLAELVGVHLGNPHLDTVLPGREPQPIGLI